jgi:hypothetical protein
LFIVEVYLMPVWGLEVKVIEVGKEVGVWARVA